MIERIHFRIFLALWWGMALLVMPVQGFSESQTESIQEETHMGYSVQQGDTLWDIAKRFYDSPLRWPDVWGMNPQISNPHRIYPGERVWLYQEKTAAIVSSAEEPSPLTSIQTPVIEEPQKESPSIVVFRGIDRVGFLRDTPQEPIARILMQRTDRNLPRKLWSAGDLLYVKAAADHLVSGQKFLVYRLMGPFSVDIDGKPQRLYQHAISGVVSAVREEPNHIWLVRVEKTYAAITADQLLMPYVDRSETVQVTETPEGIAGRILFSENHNEIFSAGFLAFIDKGEKDGIAVGQRLALVQEDLPEKTSIIVAYGECVVLAVERTTASVWITRSDRSITDSARFRSPKDLSVEYGLASSGRRP